MADDDTLQIKGGKMKVPNAATPKEKSPCGSESEDDTFMKIDLSGPQLITLSLPLQSTQDDASRVSAFALQENAKTINKISF